jgi:hypothetical protein
MPRCEAKIFPTKCPVLLQIFCPFANSALISALVCWNMCCNSFPIFLDSRTLYFASVVAHNLLNSVESAVLAGTLLQPTQWARDSRSLPVLFWRLSSLATIFHLSPEKFSQLQDLKTYCRSWFAFSFVFAVGLDSGFQQLLTTVWYDWVLTRVLLIASCTVTFLYGHTVHEKMPNNRLLASSTTNLRIWYFDAEWPIKRSKTMNEVNYPALLSCQTCISPRVSCRQHAGYPGYCQPQSSPLFEIS